MIELTLLSFIIYCTLAVIFGFAVASILAAAGKADRCYESYWTQVAFMARSIMTAEQKEKLEKLMEGGNENQN